MNDSMALGLNVDCFRFVDCHYDPATGEAVLAYAFDGGEPLFERLVFPWAPWPPDPSRQAAFEQALKLLHLVAGVSYYKACIPPKLDTGKHVVDAELADFLNHVYVHGLAEFAWINDVDLHERVHFPVNAVEAPQAFQLDLPERALVAMGGGKDSLVSLELMRRAGIEIQPVCVGGSSLIADTVRAAGLPLIRIERTLSPALAEMNAAGALNGHVPVTAINSAILLCASLLYGYRWVVFSNESSASEATLTDSRGREVNHQYSKSLDFERRLRALVSSHISPDVEYFSLLRPLSELAIAGKFSVLKRYHDVFSSCNRNFHLEGSRTEGRWCGDCPKCRFTTLAMALYMNPADVQGFTGFDLLDEAAQEEGFRALCGLGEHKPFECVGSIAECQVAIRTLAERPDWSTKSVVRKLAEELEGRDIPPLEHFLQANGEHCIPATVYGRVGL